MKNQKKKKEDYDQVSYQIFFDNDRFNLAEFERAQNALGIFRFPINQGVVRQLKPMQNVIVATNVSEQDLLYNIINVMKKRKKRDIKKKTIFFEATESKDNKIYDKFISATNDKFNTPPLPYSLPYQRLSHDLRPKMDEPPPRLIKKPDLAGTSKLLHCFTSCKGGKGREKKKG